MKSLRPFLLFLLLVTQPPAFAAESLTVAVASNVKLAFDDLATAFTRDSGIAVKPVYSSSGKIVAQVRAGAPYDLFLSADMDYPQKLYADGQAVTEPRVYAYGRLVLLSRRDGPDLAQGVSVLAGPSVRRVAVANPRLAPYGAEALKALDRLALRDVVEPRLVYAENIAQVIQYVDSGNVDAGITAKSLAATPGNAVRLQWADLPPAAYDPIAQGAVVLRHGQAHHADAARRLLDFLNSARARAILEKFHYGLP